MRYFIVNFDISQMSFYIRDYRPTTLAICSMHAGVCGVCKHVWQPELVMGHFFKTQPNPKFLDPTQPNPQTSPTDPTQPIIDTWYGILSYTENFIQQLLHVTDKFTVNDSYYSAAVAYSLADSRVFHDLKNITQSSLHPTQPNPWMDPTHDQLWWQHILNDIYNIHT